MNPLDPTVERMTKIIDRMRLRAKEKTIKMEVIEPHDYDPQPLARDAKEMNLEDTARDIFGVPDEKIVDVKVDVPLLRNGRPWFNLNKRFILKCQRDKKLMRLTWPQGSALHKPEEWLKGEPYQKEFRFPGQPLEMVGGFLDLE